MPSSCDRAPFNLTLLEAGAEDRADRGLPCAAAEGPPPWPLRVALPLIAGLSLALWAGIVGALRLLGAA